MKRSLSLILLLIVTSVGCAANQPQVKAGGEVYRNDQVAEFLRETEAVDSGNVYIIAIGDRLDVTFFVHKELSTVDLLVRSDGCITLPYVGDVAAVGLTPMQLDQTLTTKFSDVLRDPNLSVIIREPAEKFVYVFGQVKKPGGFPFATKVSLLQALALSSGLDRGAKTKHVLVIRRVGPARIVGVEVNVSEIVKGHNVNQDFWLRNYDIVYVPKTRLQSTSEFIEIINDVLFPPVDIVLRGWQSTLMWQQIDYLQSKN